MLLFMWPTLLRLFNMPNPENYSAKNIFTKIGAVVSCVSKWVVTVVKDPANNSADFFSVSSSDGMTYNESFSFDEL